MSKTTLMACCTPSQLQRIMAASSWGPSQPMYFSSPARPQLLCIHKAIHPQMGTG